LKISLANLSQAKADKTNALHLLVEKWRDQSLEHCKSVTDITSNSFSSLKASAANFKEGLHHHETISNTLENQRQFVDSQVKAHLNDIEKQNTSLIAHREKLATYRDTQERLHDEAMQSIMATIQTAVKSELEKLVTSHVNHCKALDDDGAQLVAKNQNLTQSAAHVMKNIEATNKSVCEETSIVLNNDLKASDIMQSTQNALEQIGNFSSKHYQLTSEYSTKHVSIIADIKQLDSQNTQIAQMVERDVNECSKSLVSTVLNPTTSEVKKSMQRSLDALMQVNNNVPKSIAN
jgi:phage gp36-like protein